MTTARERISDYLVRDHARLHALLDEARGAEPVAGPAYAAFRAGLLRHIALEEKLLFPAARRARGGEPIARAHELRIDHAALTSLLVATPDAALAGEIASLLGAHDGKEEGPDGVYAECERLLSAADSEALAERAAAFPEIPVAPHFDGPEAPRTAALALESARRIKPPRRQ